MKKNNYYAVVLAGGSGTRFWPMSRKHKPKQFLNIIGSGTLFEETLRRIIGLIPPSNILIVTNTLFKKDIAQQTAKFKIPAANVLFEPEGKNTAPAIAWAANRIHSVNPEALMAILPSDHLILHENEFLKTLKQALDLAQRNYLVTLGIVPTRPETGYGYLKIARERGIVRVRKFTEKPLAAKAKEFVRSKQYLWNSGMFIWKASVILSEFRRHLPKIYYLLGEKSNEAHIRKVWKKLPSVSIDYGILERSINVVTVPAADIGWSDLGSWQAVAEVLPPGRRGNVLKGRVIELACENTFVWGQKRVISTVGLKDLIIIDTHDALLICHRNLSQSVKDVVSILQKEKHSEV